MSDKIKCADCVYATPDKSVSEKNWTAYECSNNRSEYHKALLNVETNGRQQDDVSWCGCIAGEKRCE